MGSPLNSLVRMQSWQVDQRRRALASAEAAMEHVLGMQRALEAELIKEQQIARDNPALAGFHYDNYAETVIQRRERLAQAVAMTQGLVDEARDNLMASFTDLKKYEKAESLAEEREAKELAKKEQEVLDELGTQSTARKKREAAGNQ